MKGSFRGRLTLAVLVSLAALGPGASHANAGPCSLPDALPNWIEYSEASVGFRHEIFAKPGLILATSGATDSQKLRAAGAKTVHWHMNLSNLVGTPAAPYDPALIPGEAAALFDRAVASSACATPLIGVNELQQGWQPPPWSSATAQYRVNVLRLVQELAARGARPLLFLPAHPHVGGEAAAWWREVAQYADLVRQVYFNAPSISAQGPVLGSRELRSWMRDSLQRFLDIGIPSSRLGLMPGFHSQLGTGGREGLEPTEAWLEYVKLNALTARLVTGELGTSTIWSWGWGTFGPASVDPDKKVAACVYLWTRDPALCDAPALAGPGFDTSLAEGSAVLGDEILLSNRSFEAGLGGWAATNGTLASTAGGISGLAAARVTAAGTGPVMLGPTASLVEDPVPGRTYRALAWARATLGRTVCLALSESAVDVVWSCAQATGDWQQLPALVYVAEGVGALKLAVEQTTAAAGEALDVDALIVKDGSVWPIVHLRSGPTGTLTTATASFDVTSSVTSEFGSSIECALDGAAWAACARPQSYTGLADGEHVFRARALGAAGDISAPVERRFSVEAAPPETRIDAGPSGTVSSKTATFSFSASEAGSSFACSLDGSAFSACASPITYSELRKGDHTFAVRATDLAGKIDPTPATRTWTISMRNTINGTRRSEVLYGTPGPDLIRAGAGNDVILGLGGDDILLGEGGRDRLVGGRGIDVLRGGRGSDTLNARDRAVDVVVGGAGRDSARVDRRLDRRISIERLI